MHLCYVLETVASASVYVCESLCVCVRVRACACVCSHVSLCVLVVTCLCVYALVVGVQVYVGEHSPL